MTDEIPPPPEAGQMPVDEPPEAVQQPGEPREPRAAFVPTRPAPGAAIASAWGGDVHDRVYNPFWVRGSGPAVSAVVAGTVLPINNAVLGNPAWISGNAINIPTAASGIYLIIVRVDCTPTAAPWWVEAYDPPTPSGLYAAMGGGPSGSRIFLAGSTALLILNGLPVGLRWGGGTASNAQVLGLDLIRIGNAPG